MSSPIVIGIQLGPAHLRQATLRTVDQQWQVTLREHPRAAAATFAQPSPASVNGDTTLHLAALPAAEVLTRSWSFPDADEHAFRQMVALRLEADLPVSLDDVAWGYRRGAVENTPEAQRPVFAQAARTETVRRHLDTFNGAGIAIDTLTTEAEALSALYRHGLEHERTLGSEVLVLADDDAWRVAVFTDGLLRTLRRVPADTDNPALTCRRCQQAIDAQVSRKDVRCVLWCATPAQDAAGDQLGALLNTPTETARPTGRLTSDAGTPITTEQLATFGPAIGLTLAGRFDADTLVHLGGTRAEHARTPGNLLERLAARPWHGVAAALLALVVAGGLHVGALAWEVQKMERVLADVDASPALTELEPQIRAMQRLDTYRIDVESIFAEFCRHVPKSVTLSSINLSRERRMIVKGNANDPKAVFKLADALRESELFTAVNPETTEPGSFTISAQLVGVKALPAAGLGGRSWR